MKKFRAIVGMEVGEGCRYLFGKRWEFKEEVSMVFNDTLVNMTPVDETPLDDNKSLPWVHDSTPKVNEE